MEGENPYSSTMESHQEHNLLRVRPSLSSIETLNILTPIYAGIGALGVLCIFRAPTLKPFSTAIEIADGALKGIRSLHKLHSPSPHAFLFASKALIKGYKASKRLNLIKRTPHNPHVDTNRLKAFVGALNLVRYARLSAAFGNGYLGFGFLGIGYKLSKSFTKVLEGFVGIQLDSAFRKGIEALGLFLKMVYVSREFSNIVKLCLYQVALKEYRSSFEVENEKKLAYRFVRYVDSQFELSLHCKRIYHGKGFYDSGCLQSLFLGFPSYEERDLADDNLDTCLSDLLCLSIPIKENYKKSL